jgi:hypothetical protein
MNDGFGFQGASGGGSIGGSVTETIATSNTSIISLGDTSSDKKIILEYYALSDTAEQQSGEIEINVKNASTIEVVDRSVIGNVSSLSMTYQVTGSAIEVVVANSSMIHNISFTYLKIVL